MPDQPVPVAGAASRRELLSVIVPVHNEAPVLSELHRRLDAVLEGLALDAEVVFVNDGSTDGSLALLEELRAHDERVALVDLSRNFGKEVAMTAGLDHARGDAVVIIDADLQDPPELITTFVESWREGFDVVYGQRVAREGESWLKRVTAGAFYAVMRRVSDVPIPPEAGDFRLLSRRAVEALHQLPERHRFMKGLFSWVGFRQRSIPYRRDPRHAGRTKWSYWKLWNFALEGFTSFTTAPLKLATYCGLTVSAVAFAYGVVVIAKTLLFGEPVRGYASMMTVILFLGGVQLMAVGVLGEYIGRIYLETKHRPLYLVNGFQPAARAVDEHRPARPVAPIAGRRA